MRDRQNSAGMRTPDPSVLAALTGDAGLERSIALKTRRAVYNAARERRAARAESRRSLWVAVAAVLGVVLFLMPAIWSGVEDLNSGAAVNDLPVMLAALGTVFATTVAAVLFLARDDRRTSQPARHARR